MKAYLPWVLLGVSLLFNLFFALGFFDARADALDAVNVASSATQPGHVADIVVERLRLNPEQRLLMDHLKQEGRRMRENVDAERAELQRQIDSEMAKAQPNTAKIEGWLDRGAKIDLEMRKLALTKLVEFGRTLSPEQRKLWLRYFATQRPLGRYHPNVPRRPLANLRLQQNPETQPGGTTRGNHMP